jgi:hypothetical protein
VYHLFKDQGFVSVGIREDTAVFAVESVRRWWYAQGLECYGTVDELVVTADCGGSKGYRSKADFHGEWNYSITACT